MPSTYNGTSISAGHIGDAANAALRLPKAELTVGAEAANVIPVSIQIKDAEGNDLKESVRLHVRLYAETMIEALAAAYTMAETGTGTEVSTTAQAALVIDTDANGQAEVSVTDVATTSTDTLFLEADVLNRAGVKSLASMTFA